MKLLISKQEIQAKVCELALQLKADFVGKDLVIVMVLKGALCFVADLIRELPLPLDVQAIQCSSYGERGAQRGELAVWGAERLHIKNRDVLLVDDIFDSGQTMHTLLETLQKQHPRSLKTCVLLHKQNVPKVSSYRPDYVLFEIDNLFVVGYGLDFKEQHRGLPGIYVMDAS
jgi:hypoxanthine phosphoribosyltransferase